MNVYKSKANELRGTNLEEITKLARRHYHIIESKNPHRIPHVKSKYFTKGKVFINNYWEHNNQKTPRERMMRLRLYPCAIDLLRNTTYPPDTIYTNVDMNIGLHRFYGQTPNGKYFCIQVQENKRNGRKEFISVFPIKKPN